MKELLQWVEITPEQQNETIENLKDNTYYTFINGGDNYKVWRGSSIKSYAPLITEILLPVKHEVVSDEEINEALKNYGYGLLKTSFKDGARWMRSRMTPQSIVYVNDEAVEYGDYVQMTDRFETVHIWSKETEIKNAGRWKPRKITKEKYDEEMQHSWNK